MAFTAIDDGDSLHYVRGIQGGTHLDGALRIHGFALGDEDAAPHELPQVEWRTLEEGEVIGGFAARPLVFTSTRASANTGEVAGVFIIFFEDASVHIGKTLSLFARVADRCGAEASASRTFVLAESG